MEHAKPLIDYAHEMPVARAYTWITHRDPYVKGVYLTTVEFDDGYRDVRINIFDRQWIQGAYVRVVGRTHLPAPLRP